MPARPPDARWPETPRTTGPHSPARDEAFMRSALALAARTLGRSAPNPAVGCLIVREARIAGRGWTQPGGRPHAETMALAQAGTAARGATAYVTLEPCAHHGKTPPCTGALIAAGITRVVIPLVDPDPRVSGRGVTMLETAGIAVTRGCLEAEAAAVNRGFLTRIRAGRPWLTLKLAQSLDGRIATAAGESRWITGPEARREVHLARAQADAVLIGSGTARADDPMLDVRSIGLAKANPVRVIVSGLLDLSPACRLGASARAIPLWLMHAPDAPAARRAAWEATGATLIEIPRGADRRLDLGAVLAGLGARGLTRVLCEGGAGLAAGLIADDLADEIVTYTAGIVIGSEGTPAVAGIGLARLADAPHYRFAGARAIGADLRSEWRRA